MGDRRSSPAFGGPAPGDPRAQRDRRLVEQAASLAVGLVVSALRDGATKKRDSGTRDGVVIAAIVEPWAETIDSMSAQIVDAVHRQVLGNGG
jgi:hypothetical protein